MGPQSFELDLHMDGLNSTKVYVTSDGLNGQLIVGKENLPFSIEPSRINISSGDVNVPVELTFYGNETLEPGVYEGKITFLAYTGGFIAYGIKIKAKINLLGDVQEEELEIEEEPELETYELIEFITEPESEEEEDASQNSNIIPDIMGGMIGVALAALVLILWWKRR